MPIAPAGAFPYPSKQCDQRGRVPLAPTTAPIDVVPVEGPDLWKAFHRLPYKLYKDDPHWVAPLLLERQTHFQPAHNAYFKHAKAAFFLALRDGEAVGRITAQIDALHLAQHNDATGHFGFLEAIDDAEVFAALLKRAEEWLKAEGMQRVLGPVSFAMWDEPGLLVDGFDSPPNALMGHHLPYYQHRIAEQGYGKCQDLLAYEYPIQRPFGEQVVRLIERAKRKHNIVFRPLRMDKAHFAGEVALVRELINDAWADNWGFVPMTMAEVEEIATLFKIFLPADALVIGEVDGEAASVGMILPNINEAIRDLKGKLFPFGIVKLLWRMKVKGVRSGRLALMGIRRQYFSSPVGAVLAMMMIETLRRGKSASRADTAELSWVLDSNERIKHVIALFDAHVIKRYRIYEKTLG